MPNSKQGISTTAATRKVTHQSVACPFCGLVCDDLAIAAEAGRLTVEQNGCDRARAGFERVVPEASPRIGGKDASLDQAIAAAAALIAKSRLPLFGGLGTDVEGIRAIMALADKAGGVVDHVLSPAQYRNTNVLQTKGWFMSTLTETRNRADLIIIVGSDLATLHPRFFERVAAPEQAMFGEADAKRTVVLIGCGPDARAGVSGTRIGDVIDLTCPPDAIPAVLGTLRAMLKAAPLTAAPPAGISASALDDLSKRCKAATYGVIVWAPQALSFNGADLVVQAISDIVRDLNKSTRFAGLTLGGNDGAASAASVCSWQSGYPLRVSFASGAPDYDPYRYDVARMIAAGEGDLLVWTSTFGPDPTPPPASVPAIVLATPGIALATPPAVFIPVATPGLDHSGRLVRCDNVVSLPLRQLRQSRYPRLTDVAAGITAAL